MTLLLRARPARLPGETWRIALLAAGLVAAVALRWVAQARFGGAGLAIGLGFGAALLAVAVVAGWEAREWRALVFPPRPRAVGDRALVDRAVVASVAVVAIGVLTGLALAALAGAIRGDALPPLRPAVPFVSWVGVTILVAGAEEALLRGALFSVLDRAGGPLLALLTTTAAFALIHVPFYGGAALPLDLAVGLVFGGLRLATRGVAAPIAAHVTADLATWWL